MAIFQHPLWGFELSYPDNWVQQSHDDVDGFAKSAEAFTKSGAANEKVAHLLVRGEWNGWRKPIAPLWNQYITKLSIMLGAKKIGSSPFSMGGANGFETEIQLPRRLNRRLWVGILARGVVILHFMVSHPKDERSAFEPPATQIIASLRFPDRIDGLTINERGLPVPPGYAPIDPVNLVPDAQNDDSWQAYDGSSDIGALQAFYYRELPHYGWEINEFIPFPNQVDIYFARLRIYKDDIAATLGIIPITEKKPMGKIVVKYE
jgi:hypothetical protein